MVGLNWLISLNEIGVNGILADQMGLGKTIQTIAFLGYLAEHKGIKGPHLIIGPTTVIGNWMRELKKWLPCLRAVKLIPRKEYRFEVFEKYLKPGKFDIIVTSYEGINICIKELAKINWNYLIVDEAHRLKNEESLFSKNLRKYNNDFKLLITGTPIQNKIHELWALLNFIMPALFDDSDVFDAYSRTQEGLTELEVEQKNLRYIQCLHRVLRPFILKRTKDELSLSLLPKKELHLYVGLTKTQMEIYKKILLRKPLANERDTYRNILMQLRKCCNHPYLFEGIEPEGADPVGEHVIEVSSKLVVLDKLLQKLHGGHQILIFSQFKIMLNVLEDYLNIRGYSYCRFDGDTNLEDREAAIDDFSRPNSDKFVFLLSTRAGGLGINLMAADTVVLYDSDWNPQVDLQAMDRAHRIGQKNTVMVYRFVCENTVEQKMIERQQVKLKWDQLVILKGKISQKKNKYDKEELKNLISFGASHVFSSEGGTFKDEDIDSILKRGEEQTGKFNEKLNQMVQSKTKEVLNLEMDSINLYEFMGQELYDNKDAQTLDSHWQAQQVLVKASKRGNKSGVFDNTKNMMPQIEPEKKIIRVQDFQFFNDRARIEELYNKIDLTIEEVKEREEIEEKGFKNWIKNDFYIFVRHMEQHETPVFKKLAIKLKKTVDQVKLFHKRFFDEIESLNEHKKLNERFEKSRKFRQLQVKISGILKEKLKGIKQPGDVVLRSQFYNKVKNKTYKKQHDQFIIFMCGKHGTQNLNLIQKELRNHKNFRFDIFIKFLKESNLGKRVNSLMKMLLNEAGYIEEHKQSQINGVKASQNCFLMGYKDVLTDGLTAFQKQKTEQDRKKKEQQIIRDEFMRQQEIKRKEQQVLEDKLREEAIALKVKNKSRAGRGKAKAIKTVKTDSTPKNSKNKTKSVSQVVNQDNSEDLMSKRDQILNTFVVKTIEHMKLKGFSFSPKSLSFTLKELASKFLQIPDIQQDNELMKLLPIQIREELEQMNDMNQYLRTTNQPQKKFGMMPPHTTQIRPENNYNMRFLRNQHNFYQNQYYPQGMNFAEMPYQQTGAMESTLNPMYINNINNINNIKNIYLNRNENMNMPGFNNHEMIFDRHQQRPRYNNNYSVYQVKFWF